MKSNPYRSCLAGLVVWMMAWPVSAQPRYRPVAVETRFKGDDPARVERVEPELKRRAIESLGYRDVEVDEASNITVIFQVLNVAEDEQADKAVSDYGTHIEVHVDGEKVGEKLTMCMQKGEAELVGCALSGLPGVMELLPQEEVREDPVVPPVAVVPEEKNDDKVALAPLGVLGVVGIVVAATGVGLGVAGGIDLARGKADEPDGLIGVEQTDYSPRGIGFAAAGGVGLVAGAVLIAVGVTRTKKKQREQSTRVQIDASPGFSGLRITGRF